MLSSLNYWIIILRYYSVVPNNEVQVAWDQTVQTRAFALSRACYWPQNRNSEINIKQRDRESKFFNKIKKMNNSTLSFNVNDLTQTQQHKYFSLLGIYGAEDSYRIVKGLAERGRNSYVSLIAKMTVFLKGLKKEDEDYCNALYEVFELNVPVTTNEIINKVVTVRQQLEMDFYTNKLKVRCENDFFAIFALGESTISEIVDGKTIETVVYTPFAKAKPKATSKQAEL